MLAHSLTVALALLAAVVAPAQSPPPGPWQSGKPDDPQARLARGKTLASYPSPNRRYTLLCRDIGRQGQFSWCRVYVQEGRRYALIGSYQEVKGVTWLRDSSSVRYRAIKVVGSDRAQELEVEYRPAAGSLRWRVLRAFLIRER